MKVVMLFRNSNNFQTCPSKCVEHKPCVMCQQWQTGPYNETQCDECIFTVIPVSELPGYHFMISVEKHISTLVFLLHSMLPILFVSIFKNYKNIQC